MNLGRSDFLSFIAVEVFGTLRGANPGLRSALPILRGFVSAVAESIEAETKTNESVRAPSRPFGKDVGQFEACLSHKQRIRRNGRILDAREFRAIGEREFRNKPASIEARFAQNCNFDASRIEKCRNG
jgi:hypothetical protein